jgi:signal transduction histidine kinase
MPRIFEEFYRASNAKNEKKEGTGLGLAIVKVTVEKYGGRIGVASELGKGTCFTIRLPVISLA